MMDSDPELAMLDSERYHEQVGHLKDEHSAQLARVRSEFRRKLEKCHAARKSEQANLLRARMMLFYALRGKGFMWMGADEGWVTRVGPYTYKQIGVAVGLSAARVKELFSRACYAYAANREPR